ncbi:MAG: hypothetical protein JSS69_13935 [Acidobacteria bacterium]|nr:hypothetical protein [Acidobacteriota bacterium]MBS1867010.1 hypothetical protein [Acidobacteriota bacterium]
MKNWMRFFGVALLGAALAGAVAADTLELKDGRVLQGKYLGGTQAVLRFELNGEVQTFSTNDIVALTFTRGTSQPQAVAAPSPQAPAPQNNMAPAPNAPSSAAASTSGNSVTLPAGQALLVRMIDAVDSTKNHVGDIFHASLETDLTSDGVLVARKGADVYGRLATAEEQGKFAGKSELQLELTRLVIDGRDYSLVSSDYNVQGKGRGGDTAKKVGGGAVLGAIIGGIAGGGKGAAIGAAAGGGAGAGVQIITKGDQVKVPSESLLEFRLQQPLTVVPTGQQ